MKLKMFILKSCPYCVKAKLYLDELLNEKEYENIEIEYIDEQVDPEMSDQYNYYYVPTFFYGDDKLFEGAMEYEDVKRVLDQVKGNEIV